MKWKSRFDLQLMWKSDLCIISFFFCICIVMYALQTITGESDQEFPPSCPQEILHVRHVHKYWNSLSVRCNVVGENTPCSCRCFTSHRITIRVSPQHQTLSDHGSFVTPKIVCIKSSTHLVIALHAAPEVLL